MGTDDLRPGCGRGSRFDPRKLRETRSSVELQLIENPGTASEQG
jgi:hypothetical protein